MCKKNNLLKLIELKIFFWENNKNKLKIQK